MNGQISENLSESVTKQFKGVVGRAQEETGKLISSLAKESEKLHDQTLRLAGEIVNEAKERMEEIHDRVEGARGKATDALDHLEQIFEDRVSRALKRLGVPTRDDLQGIARRLEEINNIINELSNNQRAIEPDDLKIINGIGPVLEGKLNAVGIHRYQQIARLTNSEIDHLEAEVMHLSGRIRRYGWVGQAKELHMKKYGELL